MDIQHVTPTESEAAAIAELMAAKFPVTLSSVAGKLGMSELEAARRMPEDVVRFVSGDVAERFDELWAALAAWEKATLFIIHGSHVFEIAAKLSTGKRAQGYYNILQKSAVVGGHIRPEAFSAAAFLTMPFMGRESLSIVFFDAEGHVSFSVYAGRENHQIIPSVKEAFLTDRKTFCAC